MNKQDLDDEIASVRKHHTELVVQHGRLQAEAEVSLTNISVDYRFRLGIAGTKAADRRTRATNT